MRREGNLGVGSFFRGIFSAKEEEEREALKELRDQKSSSLDAYYRISQIYSTLVSSSRFFYSQGDGLDILLGQKNLRVIIRNVLSFVQSHLGSAKNGIVGYLYFSHDDARDKKEPLGSFSSFEIDLFPHVDLDRHVSRSVALYDLRSREMRVALMSSCSRYEDSLSHLETTASKASKLIFQNPKTMPMSVMGVSDIDTHKKSLEKLSQDQYFLLGKDETITSVMIPIEPAYKSYCVAKEDLSFKSGIDPSFLNFESVSKEALDGESMLNLELESYREVFLSPLINEILKVSGLKSDWSFGEKNAKAEKERAESELRYMNSLKTLSEISLSLLESDQIDLEIKEKTKEVLRDFLKITNEKTT